LAIGDRLRNGVTNWTSEAERNVRNVIDTVSHRVQFGSPPLLDPSDEVAASSFAAMQAKQDRIRRRRKLLGLPYEDWPGVGNVGQYRR
jgi:hypothetical protein